MKCVGPRASRQEKHPGHPHPTASARAPRARGDTPINAMRQARELEIEQEIIAADEAAPRRDAATLCAARHPDVNEDRVLCDPAEGVAAVFDGIGGQAGGELAARAACGAMAMALDHL